MADLTRVQNSQPVQLVDATDYLVCDISTVSPTGTENGLIVRNIPGGTQSVSGTITATPFGTYTVAGSVTSVPSGTQSVSGTITASPTGTYTVAGSVTAVPTGTYTVAGSVTAVPTGTYTVVGLPTTATTTLVQVTVSNSVSTTLLSSNANRKCFQIYNGSSNYIFIRFGSTASTTSYTFVLYPTGLYESDVWDGQVDAIANSASSVINVTEF